MRSIVRRSVVLVVAVLSMLMTAFLVHPRQALAEEPMPNRIQNGFGVFPKVELHESPLLNRIQLAMQRGRSYPMDSLDFVLLDLERPATFTRHADQCTGDLTGRYLDFLAAGMHIDATDAQRMDELFERILKCQQPDGTFIGGPPENKNFWDASYKLFMGLLRYYLSTGNVKALVAAQRNAEFMFAHMDAIRAASERRGLPGIAMWVTEPMAVLYGITGDERCLEVCQLIADGLPPGIDGRHAHGFMTTLRGLQLIALYTGDPKWNEIPDRFRKQIAERAVWPDGNIPEILPTSERNEGCAIADWIMLNLYAGFITGSDEAYEKAENAILNALALNQIVSGGFGHRDLDSDMRGYGGAVLKGEAWWCCLHNCGQAMIEAANHAVTINNNELRVNLLLSGAYTFSHEGRTINVDVTTRYPEAANTIIRVTGAPEDMKTRIRVPSCIEDAEVKTDPLPRGGVRYSLSGRMGYTLEKVEKGVLLRYGPLVMVPLRYSDVGGTGSNVEEELEGYIAKAIAYDRPAIIACEQDANGFYLYPKEPYRLWKCYQEGVLSRLAFDDLSVNVQLLYPDGATREFRFYPECYSTTTLITGTSLPMIFDAPKSGEELDTAG